MFIKVLNTYSKICIVMKACFTGFKIINTVTFLQIMICQKGDSVICFKLDFDCKELTNSNKLLYTYDTFIFIY